MSSGSIFTSRRRVEIQGTSEMTPYFTMTVLNVQAFNTGVQTALYYVEFSHNTPERYLKDINVRSHSSSTVTFRIHHNYTLNKEAGFKRRKTRQIFAIFSHLATAKTLEFSLLISPILSNIIVLNTPVKNNAPFNQGVFNKM